MQYSHILKVTVLIVHRKAGLDTVARTEAIPRLLTIPVNSLSAMWGAADYICNTVQLGVRRHLGRTSRGIAWA